MYGWALVLVLISLMVAPILVALRGPGLVGVLLCSVLCTSAQHGEKGPSSNLDRVSRGEQSYQGERTCPGSRG